METPVVDVGSMSESQNCQSEAKVTKLKGKVCWGGEVAGDLPPVPVDHHPYDWAAVRKLLIGEEEEECVLATPETSRLEVEEEATLGELMTLLKEEGSEGLPYLRLEAMMDSWLDPFHTVLRLVSASNDFREGKNKGVAGSLTLGLQRYVASHPSMPDPSIVTQDRVFLRYSAQSSAAIMKSAFLAFGLTSHPSRYIFALLDMCGDRGEFKSACDAAVALGLHDVFPVGVFCLPLVLQDKSSTMEAYLSSSPLAARELVAVLDGLVEDSSAAVARLCARYPRVRPTGAAKLVHRSLDKMIKKYSEAYAVPPEVYPLSCERRAATDLSYWVRQMFGSRREHSLSLGNWRDLVERKVGGSEGRRAQLVRELWGLDAAEASYWQRCFDTGFDNEGSVVDNGFGSENLEFQNTNSEKESLDDSYYQLDLSEDDVILVNTRGAFEDFLTALPGHSAVGVDAEFMSSHHEQKISLVQVATLTKVYLLDFETLPGVLAEEDYRRLATTMFQNENLTKIGFGVSGDVRLLSRSGLPGLESLQQTSEAVLGLETCRARLAPLLGLGQGKAKGLSGFCEAVLGRPLSKLDQISDWSRRPLRPSQLRYAALDALVCLQIYNRLEALALERGVAVELEKILVEAMGKKVKKPKKPKLSKKAIEEGCNIVTEVFLPPPLTPGTSVAPSQLRLVCDNMLQGLCKRLRRYGIDCLALENGQDHSECLVLATATGRYVVSRGSPAASLARSLVPGHCLALVSNELEVQVDEVFRYFGVHLQDTDLFSRCVLCNGDEYYRLSQENMLALQASKTGPALGEEHHDTQQLLVEVSSSSKAEIRQGRVDLVTCLTEEGVEVQVERVPREVVLESGQFWACGRCGKVYWQGSHWGRVQGRAKDLMAATDQLKVLS